MNGSSCEFNYPQKRIPVNYNQDKLIACGASSQSENKGNWHPWLLLANCVAISSLYCFNLLVKLEQWTVRFSRGHCAWLTVITYILQWNGKRFYSFKCVLIMFHGAFYLFHLIRRINSIFIAKIRGRYCCGVLWQKKICRSYDLVIRSLFFLSPQQRNILWDLCVSEALTTL